MINYFDIHDQIHRPGFYIPELFSHGPIHGKVRLFSESIFTLQRIICTTCIRISEYYNLRNSFQKESRLQ